MATLLRSLFLPSVLALLHILLADCTTDPVDVSVLKQLLHNVGGQAKLPSWVGDDPCGSSVWDFVQCEGESVTGLQLQNTKLQGQLPSTLNQMVNLQAIGLQGNNFTGPLPSFRGLARLQTAYLDFQAFTSIPSDFFHGVSSLTLLSLDYSALNKSSGGWLLPTDVADLHQLSTLSLTSTFLTGRLPDFLAALPNLQTLNLAYNYLSGSIPPSFAKASFITLQLNNQLGPTRLSGSIEPIGEMQSLSQLWLQVNAFSGPIPTGLGLLVSLKDCRLNDNQLVGPIPSTFSTSTSLTSLYIQHNHLDGSLPQIPSLNSANFSYEGNGFCFQKPGVLCAPEVEALLVFLGGVGYPTELAVSWTGNNPCSWIGISCNSVTKKVITINLPHSGLVGTISPSLANLTSLQNLILNDNNLTGTIPSSLAGLRSLHRLSLQDNNLFAPVPVLSGVDVNTSGNPNIDSLQSPSTSKEAPIITPSTSTPVVGGPLTENNQSAPLTGGSTIGQQQMEPSSHNHSTAGVLVGGITGAACMAVLTVMLVLFVVKQRKKYSRVQSPNSTMMVYPAVGPDDPEALKLTVSNRGMELAEMSHGDSIAGSSGDGVQVVEAGNLVISIQVLRNVTNNFSERNVVGQGGFGVVYKGELDDGTKIAVKRMEASVVSSKGLKEFQSEIAVLTKVRHRHLVALLGYCIDGNERLLVYEYMPLGTLSQHLFDYAKLGLPSLSLNRRLSIALDVARGMEYLHGLAHQSSFIHRDLKPSNILLGDDYRAKVSDFGLVKLATEDKSSVETRLAGTFGYLAPEYAATGRVTTKSDVFSFGVVLMELITGRKALDETQPEESVHLVACFRRMSSKKDEMEFRQAIDPALEVTDESFQSIRSVAELAGHCTSREAWHRPDMSHAVNVLSPLVEKWRPMELEGEDGIGIDLDMTLPQALKRWQAFEGASASSESTFYTHSDLDNTNNSMPSRPVGFAESFTSSDGR